jgi:hypothetical protein
VQADDVTAIVHVKMNGLRILAKTGRQQHVARDHDHKAGAGDNAFNR